MAKKKTESYDKFLADVLAQVPADKRDAVKEALMLDSVREVGEDHVLARDEFSRSMDDLRQRREAVDRELTEGRQKIEEWSGWYGNATSEFAAVKAKADRYEQEFGPLDGTAAPAKKFLTREDMEADLAKTLGQRDAFAIDTAVLLADLGDDHREKLGTRLDRKALIDFATKNNLRLDVAYDRYIAPKLQEKQKADFDKQLEQARLEGAREERSKHNLPVIASATESYAPSWQKADQNLVSRNSGERVNAAVDDFNAMMAGR